MNILKRVYKYLIIYTHHIKNVKLLPRQGKKRIIICMDGTMSHGGLVDRFKGIVSLYEVSKELDYDFYIHFTSPFILEDYLGENAYKWKIKSSLLGWNLFSTKFLYLMNRFDVNPLELIKKSKSKDIFIYTNVDYIPIIFKNKSAFFCNEKVNINFKELFQKSKVIQDFLNTYSNPRIVYHTRFTTLMGDFEDTTSLELSDIEKLRLKKDILNSIEGHSALYKGNYEIYVLSDSVNFLNFVNEHTDYIILEGSPSHIDLQNEASKDLHIKTFLDFFFIAYSNKVFQVRKGDMYNSSFSKYAAIIGDKKYEVIE